MSQLRASYLSRTRAKHSERMRSTVGVGSVVSTSRVKKEKEVFLRCVENDALRSSRQVRPIRQGERGSLQRSLRTPRRANSSVELGHVEPPESNVVDLSGGLTMVPRPMRSTELHCPNAWSRSSERTSTGSKVKPGRNTYSAEISTVQLRREPSKARVWALWSLQPKYEHIGRQSETTHPGSPGKPPLRCDSDRDSASSPPTSSGLANSRVSRWPSVDLIRNTTRTSGW